MPRLPYYVVSLGPGLLQGGRGLATFGGSDLSAVLKALKFTTVGAILMPILQFLLHSDLFFPYTLQKVLSTFGKCGSLFVLGIMLIMGYYCQILKKYKEVNGECFMPLIRPLKF